MMCQTVTTEKKSVRVAVSSIIVLVLFVFSSCITANSQKVQLPETRDPVQWCVEADKLLTELMPSMIWKFQYPGLIPATRRLDDMSAKASQLRLKVFSALADDFKTLDMASVDEYLRSSVIAFGEMLRGMAAWEASGFDAEHRLIFYLAWPRIFLDVNLLPTADMESWLRLAPDTARWCSQIAERLQEKGAPALSTSLRDRAVEVCNRYTVEGKNNPFYKGFSEALARTGLTQEYKQSNEQKMLEIINKKIVPAYKRLLFVIKSLPVSEVQESTHVLTFDEYFESPLSRTSGFIGLLGYSKILPVYLIEKETKLNQALKKAGIDASGSYDDLFVKVLNACPRVPDAFETAYAFAKKIPELFGPYFHKLPMEPVVLIPSESDAPQADYSGGSVLMRKGEASAIWANLVLVHEYIPGHFLFYTITGYPRYYNFANHFWSESSEEGWATYVTQLAIEIGASDYNTLADAWFMIQSYLTVETDIWNIGFLVDDLYWEKPGLQFPKNFLDILGDKSEQAAIFLNVMNRPIGYLLSYMRGCLAIEWCRTRAEKALGKDFDIKNFHDYILRNQAISQTIVAGIDAWIESQRK